jgi:hypothetical protein
VLLVDELGEVRVRQERDDLLLSLDVEYLDDERLSTKLS